MSHRVMAVIVSVLAVLVIVPFVLLTFVGTQPSIPAPRTSPSPDPSPSGAADTLGFAPATSPEDAAWYRIGADPVQFPAHLQVGTTAAGVTFDAELPPPDGGAAAAIPQRIVAGIADGVVVATTDDGRRSVMRSIVAATGQVHDLLRSDDLVLDAVVGGRNVYFVTANRRTGDLTGAWRLGIGPGLVPVRLDGLVGAAPEARLVAVSRFFTRLMISPDGSTLGLLHCIELECHLRAVRTSDGAAVAALELRRGSGDIFAITDRFLLARPDCPDGPECLPGVIDLATGEQLPMPVDRWQFYSEAVVETEAGAVLAIQAAGEFAPPVPGEAAPPVISIIGLVEMAEIRRHAPDLDFLRIVPLIDYAAGIDLPPGWILVQGTAGGALAQGFHALDVEDGSLVPLPALGEALVQG